jgi:hypothetical protein
MRIPEIALVAFGDSVKNLVGDKTRVLELLESPEPRVRAGAVSLLATQFSIPTEEIVMLLKDVLSKEASTEPRVFATRYLLELETRNDQIAKDEQLRQVKLLDSGRTELENRLTEISATAKPFYRTGNHDAARTFASIAMDERERDEVRVIAAMSVYHIFRPQSVDVTSVEFQEYQRQEDAFIERIRCVVKQRSNGIDRDLMRSLIDRC